MSFWRILLIGSMNWREAEADLACARAEMPVVVPSRHGNLIGIYTPAAPEVPPASMCVALLARPRFELRRMAVDLARRLARKGFTCFRFDFHGWGDSEGETSFTKIDKPATEDVIAVIRYLAEALGERRLVLWGSCYGARAAISAFVNEPAAIEGLVFLSGPVISDPTSSVYNWANLGRWLTDYEQWRQLIFSNPARRRAAHGLRFIVRRSLNRKLVDWGKPLSPVFEKHFYALVKSHARALFLYGMEDEEYRAFPLAERHLFAKLDAATMRRFEIAVWPGRVHSILNVARQEEIVAKSVSWICSLNPGEVREDAATIDCIES